MVEHRALAQLSLEREPGLTIGVHKQHPCTLAHKHPRQSAPDPARASGNNGDLAV